MAKKQLNRTIGADADTFGLVATVLRDKVRDFERAVTENRAKREAWDAEGGDINIAARDGRLPSSLDTENAWIENAAKLRRFVALLAL
jgi:hypothetical protein